MLKLLLLFSFLSRFISKQLLNGKITTIDFSNNIDIYEIPLNFQLLSLNISLSSQNLSTPFIIILSDSDLPILNFSNFPEFFNGYCGENSWICQKLDFLNINQTLTNTSFEYFVNTPLDKLFLYIWNSRNDTTNTLEIFTKHIYPKIEMDSGYIIF